MKKSTCTEYHVNPEYYRFMYERLKERQGQDTAIGAVIGFIVTLLLYWTLCAAN